MKRLAALITLLVATVGGLGLVSGGPRAYGGSSYVLDAIFDQTSGLIPQNNVMIAGARVGTVTRISLTSRYLARVQMQISSRYAPFHRDARCQIRPVALIGEMEVNCDPGTAAAGLLRSTGAQPPTVPVTMTTVPVDLTDLFDIWTAPVNQRISVALWALGGGLAGRGQDLNAILARSNPTLTLARQAITTLNSQRSKLDSLIGSSDQLLARVAPARQAIRHFVGAAGATTSVTAQHRGALASAVQRLPGLLAAARPALGQLDLVATRITPVLADLHAAAPGVDRLVAQVAPLAAAAGPAVNRLGTVSRTGLRVLPALTPLAAQLDRFATAALPVARLLGALFVNLQQRGFVEALNDFPYYVGSSLARFDQTSHLSASNFLTSACGGSSESGYSACSARFSGAVRTAIASPRRTRRASAPGVPARQPAPPAAPAGHSSPPPSSGRQPVGPAAPVSELQNLISYLLK